MFCMTRRMVQALICWNEQHYILQASAAFSNDEVEPGDLLSKSCLKSFLTASGVLQFAADDARDILACVSLSKTLRGVTAEFICQVC